MSIAGIASSIFSQLGNLQNNKHTAIQTEFQQLAQDLQSGNLKSAQADFAVLQQNAPSGQASGGNPLSQAFSALGKDLQAGNLSAAQQDFTAIQQDVAKIQQAAQQGGQVRHHHHRAAEAQSTATDSTQQKSIAHLLTTLGQDLQAGNLSAAQQAYAALRQDLPFLTSSPVGAATPTASGGVNVSA
jgi:outer membrane protein assembly factor BamD (BamD/ComL family)